MPQRKSNTLRELEQLVAAGATASDVIPELHGSLDRQLGFDSINVFWCDHDASLVDFYADTAWPAEIIDRYVADYRATAPDFRHRMCRQISRGMPYTITAKDFAARPVHAVVEPLRITNALHLPIPTSNGGAMVSCIRMGGEPRAFRDQDIALARQLRLPLQRLLNALPAPPEQADTVEEAGLLVVSDSGEVLHACTNSRRILTLLSIAPRQTAGHKRPCPLQALLRHAAARQADLAKGRACAGGSNALINTLLTPWGCYRLQLTPLEAAGEGRQLIGNYLLSLARHRSPGLQIARFAQAHELSRRETELLALLRRGYGYSEAAGRLGVAATSVKTFAQSLYRKLNVANRTELLTLALK